VNSNGAVLAVATAGYGNDAAKIVRSMFEGAVTIAYLRKKPKLVLDYIDYHKVKLWEAYLKEVVKDPDLAKWLGKERVAEMRKDNEAARPRFLNKNKDLIAQATCRVLKASCRCLIPKNRRHVRVARNASPAASGESRPIRDHNRPNRIEHRGPASTRRQDKPASWTTLRNLQISIPGSNPGGASKILRSNSLNIAAPKAWLL
jgi:hypothetical protein